MKPDSALSTTFYGGALANQQTGGDVNAALLGQSISFSANGKTDPWGGFGGAKVEWRAGAATLFAAVEGQALSDRSTVVGGRAGVSLSF